MATGRGTLCSGTNCSEHATRKLTVQFRPAWPGSNVGRLGRDWACQSAGLTLACVLR